MDTLKVELFTKDTGPWCKAWALTQLGAHGAHSSALRHTLQAITKPMEAFYCLPQIARQPLFSLHGAQSHISPNGQQLTSFQTPNKYSDMAASSSGTMDFWVSHLHIVFNVVFFYFHVSWQQGPFFLTFASNFKSLSIPTLQALVTVLQI